MFKVMTRYVPAAVFGLLTGGLFTVSAQGTEAAAQIPSVTVSYSDLNLTTAAGVDALYARLRTASRSVCNVGEGRALVELVASRTCYRQVLETAVSDAKLPTLTARHRIESAREG
jgi:UrcA family protein